MTPSIGKYVEAEDKERIAVAAALGIKLRSIRDDYVIMYRCGDHDTPLYQLCKNNPGYTGVMTHDTLRTRYCMEDIPYSLVAIQAIAKIAGVATPCIRDRPCICGRRSRRRRLRDAEALSYRP